MAMSVNRKLKRKIRAYLFLIAFGCLVAAGAAGLIFGQIWTAGAVTLLLAGFLLASPLWMIDRKKGIPILTFHSVADNREKTASTYINLSKTDFSNMLGLLKKKGYHTVGLEAVQAHIAGEKMLEGKVFTITFDDGYLNNWVNAFPVMESLGFFGVIFVATDFIDTSQGIRPRTDSHSAGSEVLSDGYLSVAELQRMEQSGILTVECHTATHTWLFKSDQFIDFLRPDDERMMWMFWNTRPSVKSKWHREISSGQSQIWGHPVYPFSRSHITKKAFYPDHHVLRALNQIVSDNGGRTFFKTARWKEQLEATCLHFSDKWPGHWETPSDADFRLKNEFFDSKKIIETWLDKKVDYLCWPGDIYTDELKKQVINDYGYKGVTGGGGRNTTGEDSTVFSRIYVKHRYVPFKCHFLNRVLFYAEVKTFEGNYYYYLLSMGFNLVNRLLYLVHYREIKARKSV